MDNLGRIAYDAYRSMSHGLSLVSGQPIPEYDALPESIKAAWFAAGTAVYHHVLYVQGTQTEANAR